MTEVKKTLVECVQPIPEKAANANGMF